MSTSYIPDHVKVRLWGLAAGRCQYDGCNRPLWLDDVTQAQFNTAYIAHIVADQPNGPRGDPTRSALLRSSITNLMILCDPHHRLVDVADIEGHPESRLLAMKERHERRIARVGAVAQDRHSEVVLYGANIGDNVHLPHFGEAASAMLPEWYPARDRPTMLSLVNAWHSDHDPGFWKTESEHLRRGFDAELKPRLREPGGSHLSVFGLAPQPLLMLLGSLIGDLVVAEVYQLHREPPTWEWSSSAAGIQPLRVEEPQDTSGSPALVLALSATITDDRVQAVLGDKASIWRVTIDNPHNDCLKVRQQLTEFRELLRPLMDRIKAVHGHGQVLHVFPAAPVACCVEFGRILMPKADLPVRIYDENRKHDGFRLALELNATHQEAP